MAKVKPREKGRVVVGTIIGRKTTLQVIPAKIMDNKDLDELIRILEKYNDKSIVKTA